MDRGSCNPLVCSPTGPHDPFGSGLLIVADTARLLVILAALVLVFTIGMAWQRSVPHGGQRMRYMSLAMFAAVVIGTELENIGNIPSYRLVVTAAGVVCGIIGVWKFRKEHPAEADSASS
jgi:hypothetical protein